MTALNNTTRGISGADAQSLTTRGIAEGIIQGGINYVDGEGMAIGVGVAESDGYLYASSTQPILAYAPSVFSGGGGGFGPLVPDGVVIEEETGPTDILDAISAPVETIPSPSIIFLTPRRNRLKKRYKFGIGDISKPQIIYKEKIIEKIVEKKVPVIIKIPEDNSIKTLIVAGVAIYGIIKLIRSVFSKPKHKKNRRIKNAR